MRLVRGGVISLGLALLGLFGLIELILRRREASSAADGFVYGEVETVLGTSEPSVSRALSRARTVVGVLGVALAAYGLYLVVRTIPSTSYLAIAIWLAAAIILHDAVLVPAVSVLRAVTLRLGRRLPPGCVALIEGAFVVGGILSLIALPEIWAKHLGTLNPTVLPGAYGQALIVTWSVLAVLTLAAVLTLILRDYRRTAHRIEWAR